MAPKKAAAATDAETDGVDVDEAAEDLAAAGRDQLRLLGEFIRDQRKAAELSLRALAERADVSNPYLSQIERGLHEPSVRVLRSIAVALNLSVETMLVRAGLLNEDVDGPGPTDTESAIRDDPRLSDEQRTSLLAVYRSYTS